MQGNGRVVSGEIIREALRHGASDEMKNAWEALGCPGLHLSYVTRWAFHF